MFDATSAAAAQAAGLAAEILARNPRFWPETARALMVHSADWTPQMKALVEDKVVTRRHGLRRWGHGVPDRERAIRSATDRLTLVIQDTLQPYRLERSKAKTNEMTLHVVPLPSAVLRNLGEMQVEMRVTLSYFIEPGAPGPHYCSHGLIWEAMQEGERTEDFLQRVNKADRAENYEARKTAAYGWEYGRFDRAKGSISSDFFVDSAVALAARENIAVLPQVGWWRERPEQGHVERLARYALIISLRPLAAQDVDIDLYTPVYNHIEALKAEAQLIDGR
jgi:hypothetical protein